LGDTAIKAVIRPLTECNIFGGSVTHDKGERRVSKKAIELDATVDRNEVSLTDPYIAGYAMDDHVVDGGTQCAWKGRWYTRHAISFESGLRSMVLNERESDGVEVFGRNAWFNMLGDFS
jgi:hypothetical protein